MPEAELQKEIPGQIAFFPEQEETRTRSPYSRDPLMIRPIPLPEMDELDGLSLRILICDVLTRFGGQLREDWLYDIFVQPEFFSYFEYSDAFGDLLERAQIIRISTEAGEQLVILTKNGKTSVRQLRRLVPKVFRDRIHLAALRYAAREKARRDMQISYEPDETGCTVRLNCLEQGREMISVSVHAPSRESAEMLSERVMRNPPAFFSGVLDLALHNEEVEYDLSDN